jgi:prepilin-type N-terminal cleavage/methylation domain-containing protein
MPGRNHIETHSGFTLTELLVVVSVLGLLAGVVIFAVGGINDQGQTAACSEDKRIISTAEETYFAQKGSYGSEAALVNAGLLSQASTMHDITLAPPKYTVVDTGTCASTSPGGSSLPNGASARTDGPAGLTVELINSTKDPLAGGDAAYSLGDGVWHAFGTTADDGRFTASVPASKLDVSITYRGQMIDTGEIAIASGTIITFQTVRATVQLATTTKSIAPAHVALKGNRDFWMSIDDTDNAGTTVAEVLPGAYTPRVDFSGQTSVLDTTSITAAVTVDVPLTVVKVSTYASQPFSHNGNNGEFVDDGNADGSGALVLELLAGQYDFRVMGKGAVTASNVTVSGASTSVQVP